MKRSAAVPLVLVTAAAAAMLTCHQKGRYCVDQNNYVVNDDDCKQPQDPRYYPHHWYYIGGRGYVQPGTQLNGGSTSAPLGGFRSPNEATAGVGTTRGVIGGAAEEASGHAGGGSEGGGGE